MKPRPALLLLVAVPILLAGCGVPTSVATNTYPDVPNGYAETVNLFSAEPIAVWVHGRTILAVVTVGSGSCPPLPISISATDATTIAITYVKSPNTPCSADLGPTTNEFKIPAEIDTSKEVTADLHFDFATDRDYSLVVED